MNNFKDGDLNINLFRNNKKVTKHYDPIINKTLKGDMQKVFEDCACIPNQEQLTERGLISEVEYNLEDVIRKLENLEIGLGKLYCRIFDVNVVDGDTEKDMSKSNPVYSPNTRIRDSFNLIDGLLHSIDRIAGDLDKSL